MSVVANNARAFLQDFGLKQKAVAKKAGYSEGQFSALLCGRKRMGSEDVYSVYLRFGDVDSQQINTGSSIQFIGTMSND